MVMHQKHNAQNIIGMRAPKHFTKYNGTVNITLKCEYEKPAQYNFVVSVEIFINMSTEAHRTKRRYRPAPVNIYNILLISTKLELNCTLCSF